MKMPAIDAADQIRLFDRSHVRTPAAALSYDDLKFILRWPLFSGAARFLPESKWPAVMRYLTDRQIACGIDNPARIARHMALGLGLDESRAHAMAAECLGNHCEHNIQVMRALMAPAWKPVIDLDGEEHLQAALSRGRGAVLWVAHFCFSPLVTKMALHGRGYELMHFSRPEHGFSKSRFGIRVLNPIRVRAESRYLKGRIVIEAAQPALAPRQARRTLADNQLVSITAGAWEGQHMARGPLLGGSFVLATGAARLAYSSGAQLLPVVTLRTADASGYRVSIAPPILDPEAPDRNAALRQATLKYLTVMEAAIRRSPTQWRGWKSLEYGA